MLVPRGIKNDFPVARQMDPIDFAALDDKVAGGAISTPPATRGQAL
ncbi:hypothetical protein [Actinokineospora cianjurensis]|uniref:Uncharacterized protein n=1 Tax=Actinokineospora cianjurensis TaxID=585224 RepID=A0A421BC85_9PSEU|nr:hypothetical protein [Actinokineospora cianjurensis]RLK61953.1 hypothetical protein CLV68_2502 [Actinokineospora cianjurensis]